MEEKKEAPEERGEDAVQPPDAEQGGKEALEDKNPQAVVKKKTEIIREHSEPQGHEPYEPPSPAFDNTGTVMEVQVNTPRGKSNLDPVLEELLAVVENIEEDLAKDAGEEKKDEEVNTQQQ